MSNNDPEIGFTSTMISAAIAFVILLWLVVPAIYVNDEVRVLISDIDLDGHEMLTFLIKFSIVVTVSAFLGILVLLGTRNAYKTSYRYVSKILSR